jgi:hypothetical protein
MTTDKDQNVENKLKEGDAEKIDRKLEELGVAKGPAGEDQANLHDKEGSASSSKDSEQK